MTLTLTKASNFTIEQLTDIYNRSRKGYLVPMQMTSEALAGYIRHYDLALEHSFVALVDDEVSGLIMLGVRPNRSWVTRLGVNNEQRGAGIGRRLVERLLEESDQLRIPLNILEVIIGNDPAHRLFLESGFVQVRKLLILQRPAGGPLAPSIPADSLSREEIFACLDSRRGRQPWSNETESYQHVEHLYGFSLRMDNGERLWIVYEASGEKLSRLTYHPGDENPVNGLTALLQRLHQRHPELATTTENISAEDPALPAFFSLGYSAAFQRIEMVRALED
ncbi:MAG: GNAT family N-acetyltransferase [Anaerolineales bacterium]